VRANFRTAITIPERSWVRFRDVISEFALKQQPGQLQSPAVTSGVGGSAGDAGGGDKEISATSVVGDSAAISSNVAAAAADNFE